MLDRTFSVHELPAEQEKRSSLQVQESDLLSAGHEEHTSDVSSEAWEIGTARVVRVGKTP